MITLDCAGTEPGRQARAGAVGRVPDGGLEGDVTFDRRTDAHQDIDPTGMTA